jgi:hypothetical protein
MDEKLVPRYFSDWKGRRLITINHKMVSGSEILKNFPFRFELLNKDAVAKMLDNGGDVMFTANDGITKLNHIIRSCDKEKGLLKAYIMLPELSPFEDTDLFIYYGNPSAPNQENREAFVAEFPEFKYFNDESEIVRDLQFTVATFELLFPENWFSLTKNAFHPAYERWEMCRSIIDRGGRMSNDGTMSSFLRNFKAFRDSRIMSNAMNGNAQEYLLGTAAKYGDKDVLTRINAEIVDPVKYFHIMTELELANWCNVKGYEMTVFQRGGADFRFVICGWDRPVIGDCKRISKNSSVTRIGKVINKANDQIKRTGEDGYGVVAIELTDRLPELMSISDDIPEELTPLIVEANLNIGNCNTAVNAVVLFWTEIGYLGNLPQDNVRLMVSRTRSKVLIHRNPKFKCVHDLGALQIEQTIELSFKSAK